MFHSLHIFLDVNFVPPNETSFPSRTHNISKPDTYAGTHVHTHTDTEYAQNLRIIGTAYAEHAH